MEKPLRRSKSFGVGLIGAILLVWLWCDTFQWRTEVAWWPDPARAPLRVESYGGVLRLAWTEAPDWDPAAPPPEGKALNVDRWLSSSWREFGRWERWAPDYQRDSHSVVSSLPTGGKPVWVSGSRTVYRLNLPVWMMVTAYIGVWWVLMGFRRTRELRRWQREIARAKEASAAGGDGGVEMSPVK